MINICRAIGKRIDQKFLDDFSKEGILYDSKKIWLTITGNSVRTPRFICGISKQLTRGQLIKTKKN
ncbi:MAG: hypothetical protein PHN19_01710 [Patescibacteria group bacterium]|nr:hypothetical protein [Patescibacteria group bacterium]